MKNFFIVFCINFYTAKITALAVTNVTKISGKSTKIEGMKKTIFNKIFMKTDMGEKFFIIFANQKQ